MRILFVLFAATLSSCINNVWGQEKATARPLGMAEYEKAKTFSIADLDKDSYVKFENTYILDRYEGKKPYNITGDDGQKKRIDLYKLIAKEGMLDLGLMIFYTTEKGKIYKAVMPNFVTDGKVWEKYFEDIHAIDKEEKFFVLKLSYVLSKELGYQLYKGMNQGKDVTKDAGNYGSDICFPGTNQVTMANGTTKFLKDILPGDKVAVADVTTGKLKPVVVQSLTEHEAKNYAITNLLLLNATSNQTNNGIFVTLHAKWLEATPNHPMQTEYAIKTVGSILEGERVYCLDNTLHQPSLFTVWYKTEKAGGIQKVYNIVAEEGNTFIMNNVVVQQKQP